RERTNEYGVLRAIGFLPRHLAVFVVGETLTLGALGAGVGLLLSYPFIQFGLGRFIEENLGGIFPYFRVEPVVAVVGFLLALAFSLLASVLPAVRAARLEVTEALRRVG